MITSNFTGNFGNNLASYLITRVIADKRGYSYGFNRYPEYDYFQGRSQLDEFLDLDYGKEHNYKYSDIPYGITSVYQEKYEQIDYPNGDHIDYQYYQPEVFDIPDNTKIITRSFQDARYYAGYKEKIQSWLPYKPDCLEVYKKFLKESNNELNEDTCILSFRAGEYIGIENLFLKKKYWEDAIKLMLEKNSEMRFILTSDDPIFAYNFFNGRIKTIKYSMGCDFFMIHHSKNIILSNSSFPIFAAYMNDDADIIAPFGWARYNCTTGYFCGAEMRFYPWKFLDRDGISHKYNELMEEI